MSPSTRADGGYLAKEMDAMFLARLHANPLIGRCLFCKWTFEGTAGEVIKAQARHKKTVHRKRLKGYRRPSTRHLHSFRSPYLSDEDEKDIQAEITRRKFLIGIEEAA